MIAEALRHMLAAGMPHDAIVAAVADMEASIKVTDPVADKRRAYDRERKAKERAEAAMSTGLPPESAESADKVSRFEVSPQTPLPNPNFQDISPLTPQTGEFSLFDFDVFRIAMAALAAWCETEIANTVTPEHLLEAYNSVAADCGLPKAKMNPKRRRSALARIRQHTIDDITEAISCLRRNPWMHGDNDRGWRADFDFLLQPKSFTRLVEGAYDRSQQAN